ncbi:MAG TPA: Gfo/Idh/MocA family oxidoreductase [Acidimicrobiia bacterium]|nr:Gfo/Idh/MocA family oxidoreductase [Acidimicrobiia bacterium]
MRVAVVGTGFGRRVVAPVFAATDGCEVVDVVSARDDAAVDALVARPDVDLVSVHSPPARHAPHVRAALAAGKAVLCDKPFALDAGEAAELEAGARAAGVVALCNFEFRYAPARARLREMVQNGTLGTVEHVQWTHLSAGARVPLRPWGWLFDRELGGGWIGAWGSHAIDALRFVFATEIAGVHARRRITVSERPDEHAELHRCTAEDGFSASLVLANGATVAIDSSFCAVANLPPRLTVFGNRAVIEVIADERFVVRGADGTRETVDVAAEPGVDRHLEPMRRFAEVVRDAVHSGEVPAGAPVFADGRACDTVLDALRAAPLVELAE